MSQGPLPVERVADPPPFTLKRRARSPHLGADAGAGGESQPMDWCETGRDEQRHCRWRKHAEAQHEQAQQGCEQRAGSQHAGARQPPEPVPARIANRLPIMTVDAQTSDGLSASRWHRPSRARRGGDGSS